MSGETIIAQFEQFDPEMRLLVFQCPLCSFRVGWFPTYPAKRPHYYNRGDGDHRHSWYTTPDLLSEEQWRMLGVEPLPDMRIGGVGASIGEFGGESQ